jgi:hypothetical protein
MTLQRRIQDMEERAGAAGKHPRDMSHEELHAACMAAQLYPQNRALKTVVTLLGARLHKPGARL